MSQKVLCTDLDGTLLYPKFPTRYISRRNRRFLKHWVDEGNKVALVTSRYKTYTDRLKKEIDRPFDLIGASSAYIETDGKVIRDISLDKEIRTILDEINERFHPIAFLITTKKYPIVINIVKKSSRFLLNFYRLYWLFNFRLREKYVVSKEIFDDEFENGHVYKVIVFFGLRKKKSDIAKEVNKLLRERFPNIESSWSGIANEITPVDCNKGAGVKIYCEHLGIDPKDVYVVGDSGNDITMFNAYHENSYVMRKAYPSVKKYAKHSIRGVYSLDKLVLQKENH